MTTPQEMLADRLIGIQEDLPNEDDRNTLGEAAHYLRQAAAPQGREALRWCGYCETWNRKPCGEQCHWLPTDPTLEQMSALTPAVAPDGAGEERRAAVPKGFKPVYVKQGRTLIIVSEAHADRVRAALARQAQEPGRGPTAEDIYACAKSTLIGFRDELTEDQIKFICY